MSVAAPAPARGRRAPQTTRPDVQPRRADGARRPAGLPALSPTVAGLLVICALLLVGIVTVQIAALQQNIAQGKLDDQRAQLRSENQNLQASIDQRSSPAAIAEWASRHGMIPAISDTVQILPGG